MRCDFGPANVSASPTYISKSLRRTGGRRDEGRRSGDCSGGIAVNRSERCRFGSRCFDSACRSLNFKTLSSEKRGRTNSSVSEREDVDDKVGKNCCVRTADSETKSNVRLSRFATSVFLIPYQLSLPVSGEGRRTGSESNVRMTLIASFSRTSSDTNLLLSNKLPHRSCRLLALASSPGYLHGVGGGAEAAVRVGDKGERVGFDGGASQAQALVVEQNRTSQVVDLPALASQNYTERFQDGNTNTVEVMVAVKSRKALKNRLQDKVVFQSGVTS